MAFLKKTSGGLVVGLFLISCFISCQAGQPKSEKKSAANEPAIAVSQTAPVKTDTAKVPVGTDEKLIVYYFHGNARCPTCYKLENYAKSVVETDFSNGIKNGKLEWKTVNVDDKGNEHYSNDYKLYTKSVVVSTQKNGKEVSWKNLDRIWTLVGDQTKYMEYIRTEVRACLEGKCL